MRFALTTACALLICSSAANAGGGDGVWQGSCNRVDGVSKPPANVTFQMHVYPGPKSAALNGVAVSGLEFEDTTGVLRFRTAGVYKDEAVERLFDGTVARSGGISGFLTQSAGGPKIAKCDLALQQ